MAAKTAKPYVSANEAARRLDVAPSTLIEWIGRGAFPGTTRMGRNYRVPVVEVEAAERNGVDFAAIEEAERVEVQA